MLYLLSSAQAHFSSSNLTYDWAHTINSWTKANPNAKIQELEA